MTYLQRRVKIVQNFSMSLRELHSASAAVGNMASKSGGARDRSMNINHFCLTISLTQLQNHPRRARVKGPIQVNSYVRTPGRLECTNFKQGR